MLLRPKLVSISLISGCAFVSNLVIYTHLIAHFYARLGVHRFITTLTLSVCGWVIINGEASTIVISQLLSDDLFYWFLSSWMFRVMNVLMQICWLHILHSTFIVVLMRMLCHKWMINTSRTCKIFFMTLLALGCSAFVAFLTTENCYYVFNKNLWHFAYKCNTSDRHRRSSTLIFLTVEAVTIYSFCLLISFLKSFCCYKRARKRARSKKRPRESLGGGAAGGLSTISANIESGNYRAREKKIFSQTRPIMVIFFLFIDTIIRMALIIQADTLSLSGHFISVRPHSPRNLTTLLLSSLTRASHLHLIYNKKMESRKLATALNCSHFLIIGVVIPLLHFSVNHRLRSALMSLLHNLPKWLSQRIIRKHSRTS